MKAITVVISIILLLVLSAGNGDALGNGGQALDKKIVELVNRARAKGVKCGGRYYKPAKPVEWNEVLGNASLKHCLFMAEKGILCHTSRHGGGTGEWLSKLGYEWRAYGENVGEGYHTSEEVVKGWLESPDHCRNIMNPDFKEAGSSYARGPRKVYWTLMLAAPGKY